jgi:hypothetical protein
VDKTMAVTLATVLAKKQSVSVKIQLYIQQINRLKFLFKLYNNIKYVKQLTDIHEKDKRFVCLYGQYLQVAHGGGCVP